jgi:hypothetical protein
MCRFHVNYFVFLGAQFAIATVHLGERNECLTTLFVVECCAFAAQRHDLVDTKRALQTALTAGRLTAAMLAD